MPTELFARLSPVFDETFAVTTMAGVGNWRPGGFGNVLTSADLHTIIPHQTAGWPSRNKAHGFVDRYTTSRYGEDGNGEVSPCRRCPGPAIPAGAACSCKWGIGPQYYISSDGTVARVIGTQNLRSEERRTLHAGYVNDWSIGVETGNLFETGNPPGGSWIRLSRTAAVEDIPGANFYIRDHRDNPREVIGCWWTTANWTLPMREPSNDVRMLFTEAQYRAWALLARFLAEQFEIPRNFSVLPHAMRHEFVTAAGASDFRQIMLADERFATIIAAFDAGWNIGANEFTAGNVATLGNRLAAQTTGGVINGVDWRKNSVWTRLIQNYRGFHGHGYSGDLGTAQDPPSDHDCPGPMFDWHRFAREVWDWWWFPFDLNLVIPTVDTYTSAVPRRAYRRADGNTRLVEYYWDAEDTTVPNSRPAIRAINGIHGPESSPSTFRLDPDSPVYALANGELVAARFAHQAVGVDSMSFALVRHEVFHRQVPAPPGGGAATGRIDYDLAPAIVYTLYMHLGTPTGMTFDAVDDRNPDWLNRVIIRFKECSLGVVYVDGDAAAVPPIAGHPNPPAAAYSVPPGTPVRPSMLEAWRADRVALVRFLDQLRRGEVALAPTAQHTTPVQVILGDFLGNSGSITVTNPNPTSLQGVRVEVFTAGFVPPGFVPAVGWQLGAPGASLHMTYQSEWARILTPLEVADLEARGIDPALHMWWPAVAAHVLVDPRAHPAGAHLPLNGNVVHLRPLDVMTWLNQVTWGSEWPKYNIAGARAARPRSRRV